MNNSPIKIGTLGTGRMAVNLGKLWAAAGHQIFFGSRNPHKAQELAGRIGANASGGTQAEAVAFGDVILLAIPWTAAKETLQTLGPFDGKILVDMTNPIKPSGAGMELAVGHTTSFAEQIAGWIPDAKVVKAFNTIYFENLANPQYGATEAGSFFCGDDGRAKAVVAQLS